MGVSFESDLTTHGHSTGLFLKLSLSYERLLESAVTALSVATTLNCALDIDAVHSESALDVVQWPLIALLARSGPIVGPKSMVWLQIT